MINYAGMKAEESKSGESFGQLPAGPYVAGIQNVKIDGVAPDQTLVLRVDVIEGEHAGYFTKRYQHDTQASSGKYPVKYKGDYRLRIPHPQSSSQYPDSDIRRMNDMIFRVETSNPGFHWDGDETKLKGKVVGINMQEDEFNGISFTRIGRLETANDVRNGIVKAMKPRKRQEAQQAAPVLDAQTNFPIVETDELPF